MTQDHTDVRHRVLVHPPIHVIRFLHISDKPGRWTASLGASQSSNEACVASDFLTGFSGAKAEGSEANARAKEHPLAPRKTRTILRSPCASTPILSPGGLGEGLEYYILTFSEALSMLHLRTSRGKTETL